MYEIELLNVATNEHSFTWTNKPEQYIVPTGYTVLLVERIYE